MLQVLGFDRIKGLSNVEQFERHLAAFLDSGAYVFFDAGTPVLLFGRQLVDRQHRSSSTEMADLISFV